MTVGRISSPDQLDELVRVTSARGWIALLGVLLLLGTATVWGFNGRLATKAEGKGVVVRAGNLLTVTSLAPGQVMKVLVKAGDKVKPGQLIAVIGQPDVDDKIFVAKEQLSDALDDSKTHSKDRADNLKLQLESSKEQREAIEQQIAASKQQIQNVDGQIPEYENLLKKGLVTKQQLLDLQERKADIESNISNLRSQLATITASDFSSQSTVKNANSDDDSAVEDKKRNLKVLQHQLSVQAEVKSPYSGEVVEVQSDPGSAVQIGGAILTLQPDVETLEVVAFVSALKVKEVKPGMEVQIVPASVKAEEFGYMKGEVRTVDEYPATDAHIMSVFQNNALSAAVTGGPAHEVRVTLRRSRTTPSGYEWSSGSGAPVKITPATLCAVDIVTREQAPISLVIPGLKKMLGVTK